MDEDLPGPDGRPQPVDRWMWREPRHLMRGSDKQLLGFVVVGTSTYCRSAADDLGTATEVYVRCMARTNIDIDEDACVRVMRRYGLRTKRDAVNFALRQLAAEMTLEEARDMEGSGWIGDLDEMRATRTFE
jgi:Arc/MetJ family transcription regulator